MRRAALTALLISLVLLTGCSSAAQDKENFDTWRAEFVAQTQQSIVALVSAIGETSQEDYTLFYEHSETVESIEVLEPQLIAKVRAQLDEKGERLLFDGAVLETGDGLKNRLSPLMALPLFMDFMEKGSVRQVWNESPEGLPLLVAELQLPDGELLTLWLDYETLLPRVAAIRSGQNVELKINFQY